MSAITEDVITSPVNRPRLANANTSMRFWLLLLALAHLPLLLAFAWGLWLRPHYQFFPLLLLGAGLLLYLRVRDLPSLEPGNKVVGGTGLLFSFLGLGLATWVPSPWLGFWASLGSLLSIGYALGGWLLAKRILPALILCLLIVPPPFELDKRLITYLQSLVSRGSSKFLDLFGVLHVLSGNVIEIPGQRLLVEEACSGIHSLFAILACTLFYLLWQRRGVVHGVLLLGSAVIWVLLANAARVVSVALLAVHFNVDAAHGWRHDALGFAIFAVSIGLTWSTDRLLLFFGDSLTMLIRRWLPRRSEASATASAHAGWQLIGRARNRLVSWPVVTAFLFLGCLQVWTLWPRVAEAAPRQRVAALPLTAESLPSQIGPWQRRGLEMVERDVGHQLGEVSQTWTYSAGSLNVLVSLDYAFVGWHELAGCYEANGWSMVERKLWLPEGSDNVAPRPLVSTRLDKPLEKQGWVWYGLVTAQGEWLSPPQAYLQRGWRDRLGAYLQAEPLANSRTYQVQVFAERSAPLSAAEVQAMHDLFLNVSSLLGDQVQRIQEGRP